jgi:hypothetical protein
MSTKDSPYNEGDVRWVFLLRGSYNNYSEYIVQVKFTHYFNGTHHEAEVLRGDLIKGGYESIPVYANKLHLNETRVFDSFLEAKNHFIKYMVNKRQEEYKKVDSEIQRRMNQFGDWENAPFNKDLIRESKIDSICNER